MHNNEYTIKEALKLFLKTYKLEDQLNEGRVCMVWQKSMGPFVNNRTEKVSFREGILMVYLSSAPLRSELSMAKTAIIHKLNDELGSVIVKDLELR